MREQIFAFIYTKDLQIKCLSLNDAKEQHSQLLADSWKHTATIDPCQFIERLYNECGDQERQDAIYKLGEPKK